MLFFTDPATTVIYTLSLHDALPISRQAEVGDLDTLDAVLQKDVARLDVAVDDALGVGGGQAGGRLDRKSTRLNSSHPSISYAVFCLKKKKKPNSIVTMLYLTTSALT